MTKLKSININDLDIIFHDAKRNFYPWNKNMLRFHMRFHDMK